MNSVSRLSGKAFRTGRNSLGICLVALVASGGVARGDAPLAEELDPRYMTNQQFINGQKPDSRRWYEVVGKMVRIEGIAWDTGKGAGDIVMVDEAEVSCSGTNFTNDQLTGRLVRVTGILKRTVHPASPPYAQGNGRVWVEYIIERPKVELIDRVRWPWMEEVLR